MSLVIVLTLIHMFLTTVRIRFVGLSTCEAYRFVGLSTGILGKMISIIGGWVDLLAMVLWSTLKVNRQERRKFDCLKAI